MDGTATLAKTIEKMDLLDTCVRLDETAAAFTDDKYRRMF